MNSFNRNAAAGITDSAVEHQAVILKREKAGLYFDEAVARELDGIIDKARQDLAQARGVSQHKQTIRPVSDKLGGQRQTLLLGDMTVAGGAVGDELFQVKLAVIQFQRTPVNMG